MSDGFVTMRPGARPPRKDAVVFLGIGNEALVPILPDMPPRADWQWDGNGVLRLRCNDDGYYKIRAYGLSRDNAIVSSGVLRHGPGRLSGEFPITRIEGHDIYIDISAVVKTEAA